MSKQILPTPEQEAPIQNQASVVVTRGGTTNHNTLRNIGLIIGREYKNRVQQRSFVISTIVILVLVAAATCIPTIIQLIAAKTNSQTKIAIINNAGPIAGLNGDTLTSYFANNLNGTSTQTPPAQSTNNKPPFAISATTTDQANNEQQQVKDGKLDILLVLDRSANQDAHFTYYTKSSNPADTTQTQMQGLAAQLSTLDKASRLGLTTTQTSNLFAPPVFTVVNTQQGQNTRSTSDILAGSFIGFAGVFLIFMAIFMYGMGVAMGVAEEKGNRIMEILVNTATPFQLLMGKIIGIGAAGLTQMAAIAIVGITSLLLQNPLKSALQISASNTFSFNFTGVVITLLVLLLVYFILGFLLYATLYAAMGALVKRQDEVQNAITPITWLFTSGYIISSVSISNPNASWIKIASYIPFWSPMLMLQRAGAGTVEPWEIALSIGLMIVTILVCTFISARIYRFGILMYGQKPGLRQLIKVVRTQ